MFARAPRRHLCSSHAGQNNGRSRRSSRRFNRELQLAEVQARWFERRGKREAQSLTERLSEKGSIKFIHSSPGS